MLSETIAPKAAAPSHDALFHAVLGSMGRRIVARKPAFDSFARCRIADGSARR